MKFILPSIKNELDNFRKKVVGGKTLKSVEF